MTAGQARRERGLRARRDGGGAEWLAALLLMAKGYRVLGFRLKTPFAEVDILALRGPVLAVVEVKRRRSLEEARQAVGAIQRERLRRAGGALAARLAGTSKQPCVLSIRLDLIALAPGRWPRHIPAAWGQD